jgi:uncharacterized protein YndB with AHSA1/START domain
MSVQSDSTSPNLEYYRKQAKALLKNVQFKDPESVARVQTHLTQFQPDDPFQLSDAQWVIARENGAESWPKFRAAIESGSTEKLEAPTEAPLTESVSKVRTPTSRDELKPDKPGGMSSEAVMKSTGRSWDEWFAIFDEAGLQASTHKQIVAEAEKHGVGAWWRQMVAVGYEQARGLRTVNMSRAGDYQVSASKTIAANMERAMNAWTDETVRERWLPGAQMTIRKVNPGKNIRVVWHEGGIMDVRFVSKSESRCSVTIDHGKLGEASDVDRYRGYWQAALDRLKNMLEAA